MWKNWKLTLVTPLMLSGICIAETPAEWAAKWQGVQNGVTMTGYPPTSKPSFKGALLDAATKQALIDKVTALSATDVWKGLMERRTPIVGAGVVTTAYGTCYGYNQGSDRLFLVDGMSGTSHHSGYPKNPASGDSTGYTTACFNEHIVTGVCRSGNWEEQAKQTLLLAIKNDVCSNYPDMNLKGTTEVSILDSNEIFYVSPSDYCADGKPLCGTTRFGDKQGDYASFNILPEKFCRASYGVLEKAMATSMTKGQTFSGNGKFITCEQLNQKQLRSDTLSQAKSVMSSLNDRLYFIDLPFSGYDEARLIAMSDSELALYFASVDSNINSVRIDELKVRINSLSTDVKTKGQTEYAKLITALTDAVKEGSLKPTYSLTQAISYIENGNK